MLELNVKLSRTDFCLNAACTIDHPIVGLFGPSGSGKTSLLNCIAGLATPDSGRIALNGKVVYDSELGINIPVHKRNIGVVFQDSLLFPNYSVRGNLEYSRKKLCNKSYKYRLEDIAETLRITHLLDKDVRTLSGGERQRVAIGRAILSEPDILLLDEPFAAIDNNLKGSLLYFLRHLHTKTGIPFIIVSHTLDEILYLTDRLMLIDNGSLVGFGSAQDLILNPDTNKHIEYKGFNNTFEMVTCDHNESMGITCYSVISDNNKFLRIRIKGPLHQDHQIGQILHASLNSGDIALANAPVDYISIQNQMPGYVNKIVALPNKTVVVIDIGIRLIVDITTHAIYDLHLLPGQKVWCLFKSQSITMFPKPVTDGQSELTINSATIPATAIPARTASSIFTKLHGRSP